MDALYYWQPLLAVEGAQYRNGGGSGSSSGGSDGRTTIPVIILQNDTHGTAGGWQLAVGGWQLAVGDWRLAIGNWQMAVGEVTWLGLCSPHASPSIFLPAPPPTPSHSGDKLSATDSGSLRREPIWPAGHTGMPQQVYKDSGASRCTRLPFAPRWFLSICFW